MSTHYLYFTEYQEIIPFVKPAPIDQEKEKSDKKKKKGGKGDPEQYPINGRHHLIIA